MAAPFKHDGLLVSRFSSKSMHRAQVRRANRPEHLRHNGHVMAVSAAIKDPSRVGGNFEALEMYVMNFIMVVLKDSVEWLV